MDARSPAYGAIYDHTYVERALYSARRKSPCIMVRIYSDHTELSLFLLCLAVVASLQRFALPISLNTDLFVLTKIQIYSVQSIAIRASSLGEREHNTRTQQGTGWFVRTIPCQRGCIIVTSTPESEPPTSHFARCRTTYNRNIRARTRR